MPTTRTDFPRDVMAEKRLARIQRDITRGDIALRERARLLAQMFDAGYPQAVLADIASKASRDVGGPVITEGAVHKAIHREKNS